MCITIATGGGVNTKDVSKDSNCSCLIFLIFYNSIYKINNNIMLVHLLNCYCFSNVSDIIFCILSLIWIDLFNFTGIQVFSL